MKKPSGTTAKVGNKHASKVSVKVLKVSATSGRIVFGKAGKVKKLDEKTMRAGESKIPKLAGQAVKQAFSTTISSGCTVLEAIGGNLVELRPDGTRHIIKSLPKPITVSVGQKIFRKKR